MRYFKRWKTTLGLILIVIIALSVLFLKVPLYYQARSYIVMYPFSKYEAKDSLLADKSFSLNIPGGTSTEKKDWYPFVMVFNDDEGFSQYIGRDLSLTILYNFGAFSWNKSSSAFFQDDSPYFNSFYGGYLIREKDANKYGFSPDGKLNTDEILAVPEYDYHYLVLKSLGCPDEKLTMDILSNNITENVEYAGYKGWTRFDSLLLVNSPNHKYRGDRRAYIQYGNPLKQENLEDFRLMTTYGRIYVRYFEELKQTVFLYIVSPNSLTIEECDKDILSKTMITKK